MAIAVFQKMGCVRSRPLLYLGLPCSGLLLFIPNVLRVFIFFSPLLLSTALLFIVLLNVPLDGNIERRFSERGSSSTGSELDANNMIDSITEMVFGEEGISEVSNIFFESRDQILGQSMNSDVEDVAEINPAKEINLLTKTFFHDHNTVEIPREIRVGFQEKHLITWGFKRTNGKRRHESFKNLIRRSGSACE